MTPIEKRLSEIKERLANPYCANMFQHSRTDLEVLVKALERAVGTLDQCMYGDLASGEGIYKAEIAREALEDISKMMEGE